MHPITVIEITISVVSVLVLFVAACLLPKKWRKTGLIISSCLTVIILLFFAVRPYWIDYQVSKRTGQLNQYLEQRYPDQEWDINRREGRIYNPYQLEVKFENEKGWSYIYLVTDEAKICQMSGTLPEGKLPDEGAHYETNDCE